MSPRPRKPRRCSCRFSSDVDIVYKPARVPMNHLETIDLAHDELEALKLCDQEGLTQEQAGVKMEVSRGTVQRLLTVARRKVATALVNRHALVIKN